MFKDTVAFSSFSVNNTAAAKEFYGQTLGLDIEESAMGMLKLKITGGGVILIYPKDNHTPATFTVLNFSVDAIDTTVDELKDKDISLEHYENMTDKKGIARGITQNRGPDVAWFKDPAGNVLSVMQQS